MSRPPGRVALARMWRGGGHSLAKPWEDAMLTAADVMTTDVVTVMPETPVRDIARLLHTKRISGVPVVSPDNRVIGIVSEGDLIGHAQIVGEPRRSWWLRLFDDANTLAREYAKTHGRVAQDVMTSTVITVTPTASLAEIAKTLEHDRIKRASATANLWALSHAVTC